MATLLSKSALVKISVFHKNGLFLLQNVIISDFLLEFEISATELTPAPNFTSIGQNIRDSMSSYLPPGDDVSKTSMVFERFCTRVPSCQVWL